MNMKSFATLLAFLSLGVLVGAMDPSEENPVVEDIEPGKTVTFDPRENMTLSVSCSFEYKYDCEWLCLPFVVKDSEGAFLPDMGTFEVAAEEDEEVTIKNKQDGDITCTAMYEPVDDGAAL